MRVNVPDTCIKMNPNINDKNKAFLNPFYK